METQENQEENGRGRHILHGILVKIGVFLVAGSSALLLGSISGVYPWWARGVLLILAGIGLFMFFPLEWKSWKELLLKKPIWYRNPVLSTVLGIICVIGGIVFLILKL